MFQLSIQVLFVQQKLAIKYSALVENIPPEGKNSTVETFENEKILKFRSLIANFILQNSVY